MTSCCNAMCSSLIHRTDIKHAFLESHQHILSYDTAFFLHCFPDLSREGGTKVPEHFFVYSIHLLYSTILKATARIDNLTFSMNYILFYFIFLFFIYFYQFFFEFFEFFYSCLFIFAITYSEPSLALRACFYSCAETFFGRRGYPPCQKHYRVLVFFLGYSSFDPEEFQETSYFDPDK